ncbi:MAG TPA: FimV/HubP family polar landmark protein, partial [Spongiibacteraceae bacterium]|nr:FimV/HubP family polar landmark protein [Spongiibacteraceae bacterium]
MTNHRRKLLPLCIAASLLSGVSVGASAIGVGEIHLQSFLGSPLQAEVPLNHLGDLSADQLKVQLGSQSDYSAMGVEYTYLHTQLKIEPIVKNGQGYVRISTHEPVTEPYLDFVLSLRWPQGQLVREFTVLLDPPMQAVATMAPTTSREAAAPAVAESANAQSEAVSASPRRAHHTTAAAESSGIPREGRYTVQRGDSLWRIANRVRPAQVSVEQVMAAIQAHNPKAFINGNSNLLKEA